MTDAISAYVGQVPQVQSQAVSRVTDESSGGESFQALLDAWSGGTDRDVHTSQLSHDVADARSIDAEAAAVTMTMVGHVPFPISSELAKGVTTLDWASLEILAPIGPGGQVEKTTGPFVGVSADEVGQDFVLMQPGMGEMGVERVAIPADLESVRATKQSVVLSSSTDQLSKARGLDLSVLLGTVETDSSRALQTATSMTESKATSSNLTGEALRVPVRLTEQPADQTLQVSSGAGTRNNAQEAAKNESGHRNVEAMVRESIAQAVPITRVERSAAYAWLDWFKDASENLDFSTGTDLAKTTEVDPAALPVQAAVQIPVSTNVSPQTAAIGSGAGADLLNGLVERIVKEVRLIKSENRDDVLIKLNPPDLGLLRIRVTQDSSGMTSHIQASSDQVKVLLQANLSVLSDAFAGAGIKMDSVVVTSGASHGTFFTGSGLAGEHYHPTGQQSKQVVRGRASTSDIVIDAVTDTPQTLQAAGFSWLA